MAVLTPIANSISAFDATNDTTFSYIISGGSQIVKNKLVITEVSTSQVVYTNIENTYINSQILPKNTLTNGVQYSYYFTVFDSNGNESNQSNVVKFYCYTTPVLTFSNITSGATINSSSYDFQIKYEQNEDELIRSAILLLYDSNNNLISSSNTLTNISAPPLYLNYTFSNFLNDTNYILVANLYTEENTLVTKSINFYVNYYASNVYSILSLFDNCNEGYVEINNNMIIIDGKSNPSPPIYLDNNTKVDLSTNGYYVLWDNGYLANGDMTISIKLSVNNVGEILYLWNNDLSYDNNKIVVSIIKEIPYGESVEKYCAKLNVCNGNTIYYNIYSNYVSSLNNLFIWIRRINNIYEIKIESGVVL